MDRREFLKVTGAGALTLFLSGCGINAVSGDRKAGAAASTGSAEAKPGGVSNGKKMKIVVLCGSPHKAGTSALLADKFIEGAQAAGHEVFRFNAAFEDINPCRGCDACGMNGPCIIQDAISAKLIQKLVDCDMVALVTPLYYYGFSAQIKTVIDRFYSRTASIHKKKSMLMATAWNSSDITSGTGIPDRQELIRRKRNMKIVVVTGSPHKAGTSALLADKFIEGAQSKGHDVFRFNAAFEDIHPCRGCDACGMNGPCVQKDAIEEKLIQKLVECDMIVLVTPLYYFGFSAQLKTVIDRFYSRTGSIHKKKSALLATAWNNDSWTMTALKAHYTRLCQYMEWQDQGQIYATGCGYRSAIEGTEFPVQALELGKKV